MIEHSKRKKEYGGFLPLELNPGKEYYNYFEKYVSRFNSVKAGLDHIIRYTGIESIFIPYYYCPSTIDAIRNTGIDVSFYHIDEGFHPIELQDKESTLVLLVDYFGICPDVINGTIKEFNKAEIIIDRAHDFFEDPIINNRIHNLYSAKKFFGVPDGAYLISETVKKCRENLSFSYDYAGYLFKSYETGTNAAYNEKKETDIRITNNYCSMSKLSAGLLKNADYNRVRKVRQDNYYRLNTRLKGHNELNLMDISAAYMYPFLFREKGRVIKKELVKEQIYVPTLWAGDDLRNNGNNFEISMMMDCVFLPIDQRYNKEER